MKISCPPLPFTNKMCIRDRCCGSAYAQTTVQGKITSGGGEPLIGATVAVKNSTDGTVTDIDGNYSLKTKKTLTQKDLHVFSYVAVSYTHLDVYKRQAINKVGTMKSNANVPMVIPPTTPVPNERLPLRCV